MKAVKYLVPLAVALLWSFSLAAEEGHSKGEGMTRGTLSAAPAGADAKVLGVLKVKVEGVEKSLNVLPANDTVAATIKDLVAKGAKVTVKGEKSADGNSITVSEIKESKGRQRGENK
jgi:hypothetical protein